MGKNEKKKPAGEVPLPGASLSDLLGKKSVRATFRLTPRAIEALSIVAGHLGIKQKSLFDHLIEDTSSLSVIAENIGNITFTERPRVQKTFVLSRRTLDILEVISTNFGTPRDLLVEYSIQRLEAVIEVERKKHAVRKKIVADFGAYVKRGEAMFRKTRELLGDDDPVVASMRSALSAAAEAYGDMGAVVEKGRVIEDF